MSNKHAIHRPGLERALDELELLEADGIAINRAHIAAAARSCNYSPRHIARCLRSRREARRAESEPREPADGDKKPWDPEAVELAVARVSGNLKKAYGELDADGYALGSLSTFKRRVRREIGVYALTHVRKGEGAARLKRVHLKQQGVPRCDTYETDHTEAPIYVIPTGHRTAMRPYLTAVIDRGTGYVLSLVVTFGRPTAEEVRVAFISAIYTRYAPDDRTVIGGLPDRILWDQGKEFLSDLVTESCLRLGTMPWPLPPYSPHLKGRCERFWDFLKQNCLGSLPGYIDSGSDVRGNLHRAQYALSEAAFLTELTQWLDWYNAEHQHRSDGLTALQRWQSDSGDLVNVPADQLWQDFLLHADQVKVGKEGVRFKGIDYVPLGGELDAYFGRKVSVRYLPHQRDFVEVFADGKHLCQAYPSDALRPEEKEEFLKQRRADETRARRNVSAVKRLHKDTPDTQRLNKERKPGQRSTAYVVETEPDLRTGQQDAFESYVPPEENGWEKNGQGRML
jgi:putative transposase